MIYDVKTGRQVAKFLLEKKAVILKPEDPFTWASGWKSPIYCDNRKLLSYPPERTYIKLALSQLIKAVYPEFDAVVGVATAGIAHAALVGDQTRKPMAYARTKAKEHGTKSVIEGNLEKDHKVVIIEDLISTGKSSLAVVDGVKEAGYNVLGMVAIFSYDFPIATEASRNAGVDFYTLSDYNLLIEEAVKMNYIKDSDVQVLQQWRKNPAEWGK
ncbi:MAG: orotate phosphoribosyltransferase [Bacteroidetes bacterium]|jgi:orotate phosphoribosyltransferase|nr:orotate phosphoribosyltransferase [Bacteroidota bacterium]